MKKKKIGKKGTMTLKLDMSKVYNRFEWSFLDGVLKSMWFPESMVVLIGKCVSTVTYQILVNRQSSQSFSIGRGLRQGDQLSPYPFIICADVLLGLLKKEMMDSNIHGIQVTRRAPKISHVLVADDFLLFAGANSNEIDCLMKNLDIVLISTKLWRSATFRCPLGSLKTESSSPMS